MLRPIQFIINNNTNILLNLSEKHILLGDFESQPPCIIREEGIWFCNRNDYSAFNTKGYSIYTNDKENIEIKFFWEHAFGLDISLYKVEILKGKHKIDYSISRDFSLGKQSIVYEVFLKKDIDLFNWMGLIDENQSLNNLVMPGSHNAGISDLSHCHLLISAKRGFVRNQDLNIYNQLIIGTRYFDIRIDYDHKKLVTYHREGKFGCNGQDLNTILYQCIDFLKMHKKEVIIMTFSHIRNDRGRGKEIKEKIDKVLNHEDFKGFIYTSNNEHINLAEIKLKDCAGKMILVFDYAEHINTNIGRFRYRDLTTNENETKSIVAESNFALFDKYTNTNLYDKMQKDQLSKLNKYGGLGKDYFFLLSWTLTAQVGFKTVMINENIRKLAQKANSHLAAALEEQYKIFQTLPNIVYLDFLNAELTKEVVQYNFMK